MSSPRLYKTPNAYTKSNLRTPSSCQKTPDLTPKKTPSPVKAIISTPRSTNRKVNLNKIVKEVSNIYKLLKEKFPKKFYAIAGSVAAILHGINIKRNISNINIIVKDEDFNEIVEILMTGFKYNKSLEDKIKPKKTKIPERIELLPQKQGSKKYKLNIIRLNSEYAHKSLQNKVKKIGEVPVVSINGLIQQKYRILKNFEDIKTRKNLNILEKQFSSRKRTSSNTTTPPSLTKKLGNSSIRRKYSNTKQKLKF